MTCNFVVIRVYFNYESIREKGAGMENEKRQTTTVSVYAEDAAKLKEMKADDQKQADLLSAVVADYERRQSMTRGQSAAADTVAVLKASMTKVYSMIENAADVAAEESAAVRGNADEEIAAAKNALAQERDTHADEVAGLKAELEGVKEDAEQLPGALAEVSKLNSRLDAAEAGKVKAEEARDAAQTAENAAKAKLSDVQSDLTDALKDAAEARKEADQLKAELTEAVNAAKLDAKDAEGRIATLTAERDAARKETEAAKATVGYLEKQAEDLRTQIEELRGQVEDLRGQVTKSQN